jgi:hypothetical protein
VDHCDVLIALWDGEPSRGRGGTKDVIDYARAQQRPVIRVWNERFEILHHAHGLDASALDAVDGFNQLNIQPDERARYLAKLDRQYFEGAAAGDVSEETRKTVRRGLFPYYVQASMQAKGNQRKYYRAGRFIYLLSTMAVASVALAILVPGFSLLGFVVEFILLCWIWKVHHHSSQWHRAWMENRFLAERIRCGVFMAICGVETSPIEVLPFMGPAHRLNDWMVRVFDEVWNVLPRLAGCTDAKCLYLNRYVREAWLQDQIKFHQSKSDREHSASKRLENAGRVVLPATIAAALLHIVFGLLKEHFHAPHWVEGLLTFIAIVFPAVAASLAGLEAQRQHVRLEERSRNMVAHLENLNRLMVSATEPARFEDLLHRVDEVMLRETQDWLMHMRYSSVKAG